MAGVQEEPRLHGNREPHPVDESPFHHDVIVRYYHEGS
jgi:hypothetical protein